MSRLEELIAEYCPDGVEYKTIDDCTQKTENIKWKETLETFQYIDLSSVDRATHTISETVGIDKHSAPSRAQQIVKKDDVIFGTTRPMLKRYCSIPKEYDKQIASTGFCVLRANTELILPRWLYHVIGSSAFYQHIQPLQVEGNYPSVSNANVKSYRMPVPPLPVQREIVRILDNFTERVEELQEQLTAELTARKKQYEYYREHLMHFDNVQYVSLNTLFPFIRNGFVGTVTKHFSDKENGVRYLEGTNIHNGVISDNEELYVTKEFHKKHIKNELKADDILMVQSGHIGECAVVGEKYKGANCHALIIMSNGGSCISKFYVHYFHTIEGMRHLKPAITDGNLKHVLAGKMSFVKVPFPPMDEQNRIVSILDRFEELLHDISSGLPAEIEARQKQYEYYRDKLLTFKEFVPHE